MMEPPAKEWKCPAGYTSDDGCTGYCENQCWMDVDDKSDCDPDSLICGKKRIYTWRV